MFQKIFQLLQFIRYLWNAKDEHSLHSPFAFNFYTTIIKKKPTTEARYQPIELLRKELLKNDTAIQVLDFGAGSSSGEKSGERTISTICKRAEKPAWIAHLIARIIEYQKPKILLDLGTSLGLTTLYQAYAAKSGKVYTFEGCPQTSLIAINNFKHLSATNIDLIQGNIDTTLPDKLAALANVDFVFFDANHRYEPTVRYFENCLTKATEESIFIFDDIYWSAEMKRAWETIKQNPSVGLTMDIYYLGIVFFRKKQPVQHFIVS